MIKDHVRITHNYFKIIQDFFKDSASTQLNSNHWAWHYSAQACFPILSNCIFFHFNQRQHHELCEKYRCNYFLIIIRCGYCNQTIWFKITAIYIKNWWWSSQVNSMYIFLKKKQHQGRLKETPLFCHAF